ncbi:MAG: alpha/beta hydrolase-fold protein [Pseudomonadota bacterium]
MSLTTIPRTSRHTLYSEAIQQKFVIDVWQPQTRQLEPMPVVYLTDANLLFPMVTGIARLLKLSGEVPAFLLVGIGYADDDNVLALRQRDLTPSVDNSYQERGAPVLETEPRSGGAALFADFIEAEVKPFVQNNFNASADDEMLAGDSLGGLFTMHTMFAHPERYRRYLAASPSIWWHERMLLDVEVDYAENHDNLNAQLFISIGEDEEQPDNPHDWARMVTNMREMSGRLGARNYPDLRLSSCSLPGETHFSVMPVNFSRGLRALYKELL